MSESGAILNDNPLLKEFCDCNPNFWDEVKSLPNSLRSKFVKKFEKENNRMEFLSKVSEFKFVQYFIEKGLDIEYEPKVMNKTPDLKIKRNGVEIIGDVKRFNLSEEDQIKQRFFYELATYIKSIKLPYYVAINQLSDFLFELHNPIEIKEMFYAWLLEKSRSVGEIFKYNEVIEIKIRNVNGIKEYILYTYHTNENKIHPDKLLSVVKEKIINYKTSIIDSGFPFFVCIDLLFDSMIDPEDFELKFRGCGVMDIDTMVKSTDLGLFYTDEDCSNLVGILIRYNSTFYWIKNYRQPDYLGI